MIQIHEFAVRSRSQKKYSHLGGLVTQATETPRSLKAVFLPPALVVLYNTKCPDGFSCWKLPEQGGDLNFENLAERYAC